MSVFPASVNGIISRSLVIDGFRSDAVLANVVEVAGYRDGRVDGYGWVGGWLGGWLYGWEGGWVGGWVRMGTDGWVRTGI